MFGVGAPLRDLTDTRTGTFSPVWDMDVGLAVELALAGSEQRSVWLHPSPQGGWKCTSDDSEPNRYARWWEVRFKGVSEQLRALYPTIGPRKYPRGLQHKIGHEEARALLLGGVTSGGLQLSARPDQKGVVSSSGAS